jgi:hypothetical protein
MITNSFGIIINARNKVNTRFLPLNCSLAKAKAAKMITNSMSPVVTTVNIIVFTKYPANGTAVNASP